MLGVILGMAMAIYALRFAGFLLAGAVVSPTWEYPLRFVPVATLTALLVASLIGRPDETPWRLIAAVGAGFAARRTGRAWVCIVVGMAIYGLLCLLYASAGESGGLTR